VGPGLEVYQDEEEHNEPQNEYPGGLETPRNGTTGVEHDDPRSRITRRSSVDSLTFQRDFISHRENSVALPTPPYTPTLGSPTAERPTLSATSSNPSVPTLTPEDTPAHTLEEFRNALRADLEEEQRSESLVSCYAIIYFPLTPSNRSISHPKWTWSFLNK
jgi:arrestin-related trafficking adapter 3/6